MPLVYLCVTAAALWLFVGFCWCCLECGHHLRQLLRRYHIAGR